MKKETKTSLTKKLDKAISLKIRSRRFCQRCFNTKTLQCCHIFSRKNRAVRWDELNLLCLCAGCHFWAHQNPTFFTEFVINHLGKEYYILAKRSKIIKKRSIEEMKELLKRLKNEII